jgi:hypothetical protein
MKSTAKILFILISIATFSCRKTETYPIEPQIEFSKFLLEINPVTGKSERGILEIKYKDGDGDIGLNPSDTFAPYNFGSPYYYNMIIKYYEKQNGVFKEVPLLAWNPDSLRYDTLTFNVRIPDITPKTGNKNIKGIIQDTMFIYNPLSDFDTIKFSVYIYDRALHKSNEITTPEIVRIK